MNITFRKCNLKDLEELQKLSRTTFTEAFEKHNDPKDFGSYLKNAFSKNQLQRELENHDSHFFYAEVKNQIVGYLKANSFKAQNEFHEPNGMELERIYVKSKYQGRGIGLSMLSFVESMAKANGKTYL